MKRLSSESGESIAEVLIALLIAAVALMMLASMISSTVSIVNKSKTKMDEYYQNNAVLELQALALAAHVHVAPSHAELAPADDDAQGTGGDVHRTVDAGGRRICVSERKVTTARTDWMA